MATERTTTGIKSILNTGKCQRIRCQDELYFTTTGTFVCVQQRNWSISCYIHSAEWRFDLVSHINNGKDRVT